MTLVMQAKFQKREELFLLLKQPRFLCKSEYSITKSFISNMGLSSLPAPSEGVLCVLLVNTALSISIVKGIMRSILHIIGIRLPSASPSPLDYAEDPRESSGFHFTSMENIIEELKSRTPTARFDMVCSCKPPEHDCSVCLTPFKPESEINCLSCGHLFHKACLEKWLDYWNITCPLCRSPLIHEEDISCFQ